MEKCLPQKRRLLQSEDSSSLSIVATGVGEHAAVTLHSGSSIKVTGQSIINNYYDNRQAANVPPCKKKKNEVAKFYNVPAPMQEFGESRESFLRNIENTLKDNLSNARKIVVISGMQGIGKTQLACQFANQQRSFYQDRCFWVEAVNEAQIIAAFDQLADVCQIREENIRLRVEAVYRQLDTLFPVVLLIFDDWIDAKLIGLFLPKSIYPHLHILVTTHNVATYPFPGKAILLTTEDRTIREDNWHYIKGELGRGYLPSEFLSDSHHLTEALQHLPLAISQAIHYMKAQNISIREYLKIYQKEIERQHLLKIPVRDYNKTVFSIWQLSLRQLSPSTQRCIRACAYLNGVSISRTLVSEGFFKGEENLVAAAIRELAQYALLMPIDNEQPQHEGKYSMHGLIQQAAQLDIELGCGNETWLPWLIKKMTQFLSRFIRTPTPFSDAVNSVRGGGVYRHSDGEKINQLKNAIPHIQSLLVHATRLKIKQTTDDLLKGQLAALCYHLGLYYSNIAYDIRKAKKYLLEGLSYQESIPNQTELVKQDIIKSHQQLFKVYLKNASSTTDNKRKNSYFKKSIFHLKKLKFLHKELNSYEKNKAGFFINCALYYSKAINYFQNKRLKLKRESEINKVPEFSSEESESSSDEAMEDAEENRNTLSLSTDSTPSLVEITAEDFTLMAKRQLTETQRREKVKYYLDKALVLAVESDSVINISQLQHYYGNYYLSQRCYPEALDAFLKALELKVAKQEKNEIARTLARISRLYHQLFENKEHRAEHYLNQAILAIRCAIYYQACFQTSFFESKIADNLCYLSELYEKIKKPHLSRISVLAAYEIKHALGRHDIQLERQAFQIAINAKNKIKAEEISSYSQDTKRIKTKRANSLPDRLRQSTLNPNTAWEMPEFNDKFDSFCAALNLAIPPPQEIITLFSNDCQKLQTKKPTTDILTQLTENNRYSTPDNTTFHFVPIHSPLSTGERAMKITADRRPSDYEYALLSQHIYSKPSQRAELPNNPNWRVHKIKDGGYASLGFYGAIYKNTDTRQAVVVFRGTHDTITWLENLSAIFMNKKESVQKFAAFELIREAVEYAQDEKYQLSLTGHSLGGFLAELGVYFCHYSFDCPDVSAVTFESPGAKESIEKLFSEHERIDLNQLDITTYLSYPNIVNCCNHHVGTIYGLYPQLDSRQFGFFSGDIIEVHSMDNIVNLFDVASGYPKERVYIASWPKGRQQKVFKQYAKQESMEDGMVVYKLDVSPDKFHQYLVDDTKHFQVDFNAKYKTDIQLSPFFVTPLRHFSPQLQQFLKLFYQNVLTKIATPELLAQLSAGWIDQGVPKVIVECLLGYTVQKNNRSLVYLSIHHETLTVSTFRNQLSYWLQENNILAHQLFASLNVSKQEQEIEVCASALQAGSHLTANTDASFEAIGIEVSVPEDTDERNVAYVERLAKPTLERIAKITAVGVPTGHSVVDGTGKTRFKATGVKFSAEQRDIDTLTRERQKAGLASTHQEEKKVETPLNSSQLEAMEHDRHENEDSVKKKQLSSRPQFQ